MSYLTHSKFFITMIPDTLPLFRARFEFFDGFCTSNSLPLEIWSCYFPLSHKVLDFSTNWFFAPLSAQGLEFFWKLILISSSARDLKLIFIYWYFYPLPSEVLSWSLFTDLLTWLDLHWIANAASYTRLSGLTLDCHFFIFHHTSGLTLELPVLFIFSWFLFSLTWTYLWVLVWLCFDFIAHVYLIGLTPLMPTLTHSPLDLHWTASSFLFFLIIWSYARQPVFSILFLLLWTYPWVLVP